MIWPLVQLGDVADISAGNSAPQGQDDFSEEGTPFVRAGSLSDLLKGATSHLERIAKDDAKRLKLRIFPKDSILFAKSGMSCMKGYVYRLPFEAHVVSHLAAVQPGPDLCPAYAEHALRVFSPVSLVKDEAYPSIRLPEIARLKIPLPPVEEQRRIAAILDQADALRRLRTSALGKLNTLGQAVFHETFGGPASNPRGWPMGVIGDLLKEAKYGSSGKANSEGRGLPMLRMGNVTYDGRIDLSDLKHIELSDKEFDKYTTRPGDLLFNRTNSKELVGKTAVVTQAEPMAIAGYLVRGRANARGNTHYISGYLNSTHGKAVLRNMCKNIVGMANINAKEFQSIPIAIPPVELQHAYAEKLMSLRAEDARFRASLDFASTLFASLQHRAFKGEL